MLDSKLVSWVTNLQVLAYRENRLGLIVSLLNAIFDYYHPTKHMARTSRTSNIASPPPANIPTYLIKESFGGKVFYYKGYQEILSQQKTLEA